MHIPTCQTQELEILTFEQALVPTQWDFDREKWLYIPDQNPIEIGRAHV